MAAVGLVGDIARALGSNIVNYSDLFMQILLENLAVSKTFVVICCDLLWDIDFLPSGSCK